MNSVEENSIAFVQFLSDGDHLPSEEIRIETTFLHHLELEIGHQVLMDESSYGPTRTPKKTSPRQSITVEIVERLREQMFRVRAIDALHRRSLKSDSLGLVTAGKIFLDHRLLETNSRRTISRGRLNHYMMICSLLYSILMLQ